MSSSEEEIVVLSSGPSSPSEVSGSEYTEDEVLPEVPTIAKRRRLNRPAARSDGHNSDSQMVITLPELEVTVPKYNPKNDLVKENVDLRSLLDGLKSKVAEFKRIAFYNMSLYEKNISLLKDENDDLKKRLKDTSDDRLDQFAVLKEPTVPQTTDNSALIDSLKTKIQLLEKENTEMKREREKIHLLEQQKKTLLLRVNHLELNLKSEMRRSRVELKRDEAKEVLNEELLEKLNQVCVKTEETEAEIQTKHAELSLKDMKIEFLQRIIKSYEMESSLTKENQKTERQEMDLKELRKNVETLVEEHQERLNEVRENNSLKNNPTVKETLKLFESHFTLPFEKDSMLLYNLFGYEIRETEDTVVLTSKFNNVVQFVLERMEGLGLYNLRYPKFKELLTIEHQEKLHKVYQDHIEKSYELPLFFAKMQLIISGATTMTNNYQYSLEEQREIQERLNMRLGPEFVSTRQGPGGSKVSYIEGNKAIELANRVLGFNGWSTSIVSLTTDYCDEGPGGKASVGITSLVRVTIKDGTFREDIGYGTALNMRTKGEAYEKAKKEAVTDGIKRCLRTFGNALGNCLYDKLFLKDIQKCVSNKPEGLNADDLLRPTTKFDNQSMLRANSMLVYDESVLVDMTAKTKTPATDDKEFDEILMKDEWILDGVIEAAPAVIEKENKPKPVPPPAAKTGDGWEPEFMRQPVPQNNSNAAIGKPVQQQQMPKQQQQPVQKGPPQPGPGGPMRQQHNFNDSKRNSGPHMARPGSNGPYPPYHPHQQQLQQNRKPPLPNLAYTSNVGMNNVHHQQQQNQQMPKRSH